MEQWIADKLHDVIGISDRYIADFLLALAKRSSNVDDFLGEVKATETVTVDETFGKFARELFAKLPRQLPAVASGPSTYELNRLKEEKARQLQRWNESFKLLSDEDSDNDSVKVSKAKHSHIRKRNVDAGDSDEETSISILIFRLIRCYSMCEYFGMLLKY
ncbi:putative pre-mRNA-splicing factor ATP-dependent RNA helicase DHX16 [Trichinella spiralis]|uniref:putative pre-mRNA-splicing factor ATP-dependent RNA helicase DHX16 n=1 Tax=Trichinella spiralis TaxID=6334 RepID=UPI0001EFBEE3|nr:putative pre-mRNA-splicing factor ATP-dependent RNA helicase DHX16 [Trichinella spiralis]